MAPRTMVAARLPQAIHELLDAVYDWEQRPDDPQVVERLRRAVRRCREEEVPF